MALKKSFATPYGVAAEYWKISGVAEDFLTLQKRVLLAGYLNEAARQAGAQPLATQGIELKDAGYTPEQTRAQLYAALKATATWDGSEDC